MDILQRGDGWVALRYSDGTVQTIHTSLNRKFLASVGAELRAGFFFDIERLKYVKYREDAFEVEVYAGKPDFDSEVLNFASKFI